ncbi:alpha/beta fold hydrolase [Flagellimonas pacifica]|uniref:Pimeloyl-ACP methyl ester carboxylesterase n=1 Tax=Flagellimonas pacifica TaxID=1247520 RepID=A0A285MXY6_9FLAO|nr:alpha/beta hydrolase [Allomuricauda parva]SNZ00351.1 Pimeloyl-ACP methyl ester carboxylesterase [Allomuricauda parva]
MATIYKSAKAKKEVLGLYDKKLESLNIPHENIDINTTYGNTRVIKTGNENGQKVVLFHGINAGAPLTLESVKKLRDDYLLFAIDTIGQATKSDETVLDIKDSSYAIWAEEVLRGLNIEQANFIGISYGSFILQKLITYKPETVSKCIFVVPSGLVNGAFLPSFTKLTIPLVRFFITKKDKHLRSFIKPFVPLDDTFMFKLQKALLLGVKIDFRRPTLLKKEAVSHYKNPVYMIVADDDIFFPANKAVKRAEHIFSNLKEVHYVKNCKHMPRKKDLPEIQQAIKKWISDTNC